MPVDFDDPKIMARVWSSVNWSEKTLRVRREQRLQMLRLLVGFWYGEFGAQEKQPINLIELGTSIYQQQIASHNPMAKVETDFKELRPSALTMQLALNQVIKKINLADSLNDAGFEALFYPSVMKIGLYSDGGPPDADGNYKDPGSIFAEPVLGEDLILDMTAKKWNALSYIGDRFRVPLEWVKENSLYSKKVRNQVQAPALRDNDLDRGGPDIRSETMSQGYGTLMDEFQDHVDLMAMYFPFQNEVVTLVAGTSLPPLRRDPWKGPAGGPYRNKLLYGKVSGNLMPRAIVPMWVDLHETTNRLFRKASNQAERQKTVVAVEGRSAAAGKNIVEADDGDMIYTDNADGVNEKSTGGPNQQTLAMVMWAKQMLSYLGGNWDAIGGLAPQSQTLGQDRLLTESATGRIKDMQLFFSEFTAGCMEDIAFWMWQDPTSEYHLQKPVAGTQYTVPAIWSPETRQGDFFKYNYTLNPYAGRNRSPSEKANAITQFVTQILLPAMPGLLQQGMAIDWERFLKMFADHMDLSELNEIITYSTAQPGQTPGQGQPPGMPSVTTRNNVRHNVGGGQDANNTGMMQMMMGNGIQPAQLAQLAQAGG